MPIRETLEQANCVYVRTLDDGGHIIFDETTRNYEVWFENDNHASYGLLWQGHDLEFARSASSDEIANK